MKPSVNRRVSCCAFHAILPHFRRSTRLQQELSPNTYPINLEPKRIKTEHMEGDRPGKQFHHSSTRSPPPHGYRTLFSPSLSATDHSLVPGPTPKFPAPAGPGNPQPSAPAEPTPASSSLHPVNNTSSGGQSPGDPDPHNVPPELKEEDWSVVFNPKVKRVLDVALVHTLMHER